MTTDNNMFDVSGWFRGPVNKKMMLPDNESMFGGIDYWISRPVFNDQVVIEMSFSVSHQSLKTDDLLLLFEGFKYDYEKMIRSAFRNENDSMNLRSHEFSGVVFYDSNWFTQYENNFVQRYLQDKLESICTGVKKS